MFSKIFPTNLILILGWKIYFIVNLFWLQIEDDGNHRDNDKDKVVPAFKLKNNEHTCTACGKKYKQFGSMKLQIEKNHGNFNAVVYFCKKCTRRFDTKKKLTRHENSKTECCKIWYIFYKYNWPF